MIIKLCKSNKTTYKATYLLFIFVEVINAIAVKVIMKLRSITGKINRNRSVNIHAGTAGLFSMVTIAITALIFLVFQGCAKVGNPTGGPADINPPKYVSGSPENRSTNFTGDKIDITFDEYIQLKDQNREI